MNILQISKDFAYSGVHSHMIELSKELKENGHNVIVVTSNGPMIQHLEEAGIRYNLLHFTSMNPFVIVRNLIRLSKIIKEEQIQVAHTHWRSTGVYLKILSKFRKFKFVWTNHLNHIPTDFIRRNLTFYDERAITVSNDMIDMLKNKIHIPQDKIKVIYNGIREENYYKYNNERMEELKEKYNIKGKKVISLLGRLDPVKGHLFLLDALAEMKNKYTKLDWKLLITGDESNSEYVVKIKEKAQEYKLLDRLVFTGHANPVDILNVSDVMVLPSTNEGFPIVCIEAFSMKVPVVRTKVGGYSDIKEYCIGVEYGDNKALCDSIIKCLLRDKDIDEMVENAYLFFKDNLTTEIMSKKIIDTYQEIMSAK